MVTKKKSSARRPAATQADRVLSAVKRGAQDSKTIAKLAKIPQTHVHPLLNRLRSRGLVKGYVGELRAAGRRTH